MTWRYLQAATGGGPKRITAFVGPILLLFGLTLLVAVWQLATPDYDMSAADAIYPTAAVQAVDAGLTVSTTVPPTTAPPAPTTTAPEEDPTTAPEADPTTVPVEDPEPLGELPRTGATDQTPTLVLASAALLALGTGLVMQSKNRMIVLSRPAPRHLRSTR